MSFLFCYACKTVSKLQTHKLLGNSFSFKDSDLLRTLFIYLQYHLISSFLTPPLLLSYICNAIKIYGCNLLSIKGTFDFFLDLNLHSSCFTVCMGSFKGLPNARCYSSITINAQGIFSHSSNKIFLLYLVKLKNETKKSLEKKIPFLTE